MLRAMSRGPLTAALLALALALALTWPVALAPAELAIGHPGNDTWNHIWGYWWVGEELSAGRFPSRLDLLSFPQGGTLFFIDTVQAIITWPLQLLLGPVFAYNAAIIGGLWLSGYATWLLSRRLSGDETTSLLALVLFEACPHLLGQTYNGISETVCAGWVPLTLWALLGLLDRPSTRRALSLGLIAGLGAASSWYYGLMMGLAGGVLLLWLAARQPWQVEWRRALPYLALAGLIAAAPVLPLLLTFRASLGAADALVSRDPDFVWRSLIDHNITDLLAFFRPGKTPSPDLFALYGEELLIVIYLGWTALSLTAVALFGTRRRAELSPYLWLGLLFFAFALGPYLYVGGSYLALQGRRVPLPFLALFEGLPLFDRISHPFRFTTGVSLWLALAAAQGLRHLLIARSIAVHRAATTLLGLLALAEVAWLSPARLPVPAGDARAPVAYTQMREDPVPGAVLDLPLTVPNLERAVYVWYQSAHGRPVPWGLNDPMPQALLQNRLATTLIRIEASRAWTLPPRMPELDLVVSARLLARGGYRYVVMHRRLYPAAKGSQTEALLTGLFGEPQRHESDGLLVYTLPDLRGGG
jgi:Dolichyl-phosphate-mannose-protein mannosyltransferase